MAQKEPFVTTDQARTFLVRHFDTFDTEVADVEIVGEGAWSRAFGFSHQGRALVARFGRYVDDFENDMRACRYAAPDLPVPQLFEIGSAFDGYYAISARVYGVPLETVDAAQWRAVVPSMAAAMEAMRTADIAGSSGWGGWDKLGDAPLSSWRAHLLSVDVDTPDRRTYGWRRRMKQNAPAGEEAFLWGYARLAQTARDDVPRSLLHNDLINRNALVQGDRLSGIFDWGCSIYGDHLYELAWFTFWSPWHPEMDVSLLAAELERRWQETGYLVENKQERLDACYLHIGLDHLAYNAYVGDWETLLQTAERMRKLVGQAGQAHG